MEMTSASVCFATRSAVRWRVPVSSDAIEGIRHELDVRVDDLLRRLVRMIAPSIFASS
jgi:hypothetical protein